MGSLLKRPLNPFGLTRRSRQSILLLVLFCQLLGAWIPRGMMPGVAGTDSSLLVFCGAQTNPALLKLISDDWQQRSAQHGNEHATDLSASGHCAFGALAAPVLTADGARCYASGLNLTQAFLPRSETPRFTSHSYLLGPQNKAPPFFLSV